MSTVTYILTTSEKEIGTTPEDTIGEGVALRRVSLLRRRLDDIIRLTVLLWGAEVLLSKLMDDDNNKLRVPLGVGVLLQSSPASAVAPCGLGFAEKIRFETRIDGDTDKACRAPTRLR